MIRRLYIFILSFVFLISWSCSAEIDKKKFGNASVTVRSIQDSIAAGPEYNQFSASVQKLSDEITLLKGSARSGKEQELLKAYTDLLQIYNDSLVLWKYRLEFTRYGFVPKGLIYVGQDIDPLVEKYSLNTTSHIFGPTRQAWRSIPESSIQVIWEHARLQYAHVKTLMDS